MSIMEARQVLAGRVRGQVCELLAWFYVWTRAVILLHGAYIFQDNNGEGKHCVVVERMEQY
jgi:hypothetical protein